jgi:predicted GNAT family acetyltransferase
MPATLHDNPELSRFEMDDDGVLAVANYRLADNLITFTHTEVPPQARAHGLASRLIVGALETARARGLKVAARCSFVRDFLATHSEYRDLMS